MADGVDATDDECLPDLVKTGVCRMSTSAVKQQPRASMVHPILNIMPQNTERLSSPAVGDRTVAPHRMSHGIEDVRTPPSALDLPKSASSPIAKDVSARLRGENTGSGQENIAQVLQSKSNCAGNLRPGNVLFRKLI